MDKAVRRNVSGQLKNVLTFVAAMLVGAMAYTGELVYTPVVLVLLVLALGIGRYGSTE